MSQITEVSYEEAMRRFKNLYRMEKLPDKPVSGATWYANDYSCAALVKVGNSGTYRIKGTVTAPEMRGQGYGDMMLRHLITVARDKGATLIEAFAKNPGWYLRNGFTVKRVTSWDTTVVQMSVKE